MTAREQTPVLAVYRAALDEPTVTVLSDWMLAIIDELVAYRDDAESRCNCGDISPIARVMSGLKCPVPTHRSSDPA